MPPGQNPNPQLPDQDDWAELISAYLDDELTPAESAQVEQRLAEDADARRLLEDLKALTSALHELPQEPAPRDLTDAILKSAERRMLTTETRDSHGGGGGLPFGRSPRGWMWAAAAIAAAVLLMVTNRDDPAPTVAKSDASADAGVAASRSEPAEVFAPATPAATTAEPDAAREATDRSNELSDLSTSSAHSEPALEDLSAADEPAASAPRPAARAFSGGFGGAGGGELDGHQLAAEEPVVVRLDLRPEAFENRLVDAVLGSNGIVVEPTPVSLRGGQAGRRALGRDRVADGLEESALAERGATRSENEKPTLKREAGDRSLDIMLVSAPAPQVADVVSEFNRDVYNIRRIAIDPAVGAPGRPLYNHYQEETLRQQQEVAQSLGVYSRAGVGPQQAANAPALEQQRATPGRAAGNAKAQHSTRIQGVAYRIEPDDDLPQNDAELYKQLNLFANKRLSRAESAGGRDAASAYGGGGELTRNQVPVLFVMRPASTPEASGATED